jgi:hypothetical protein
MKSSKTFFLFLIIFLVIGGIVVWQVFKLLFPTLAPEVPTGTVFPDIDERVVTPSAWKVPVKTTNGTMEVNDFLAYTIEYYPGDVYLIASSTAYTILYYQEDGSFLITLDDGTNVPGAREKAERALLNLLQVSENDACRLLVDLTIPPYVDFMNAGSYGLSFCPGSRIVPQVATPPVRPTESYETIQ